MAKEPLVITKEWLDETIASAHKSAANKKSVPLDEMREEELDAIVRTAKAYIRTDTLNVLGCSLKILLIRNLDVDDQVKLGEKLGCMFEIKAYSDKTVVIRCPMHFKNMFEMTVPLLWYDQIE